VRTMGEYRYNRDRFHEGLAWIVAHPRAAGILVIQRFWFSWFPSTEGLMGYRRQRARSLFLHAFTLASLLGIYLTWKQRKDCFKPIALFSALFPVIYYIVEFDARYRYPILWITWLLAAHAVLESFSVGPTSGRKCLRVIPFSSAIGLEILSNLRLQCSGFGGSPDTFCRGAITKVARMYSPMLDVGLCEQPLTACRLQTMTSAAQTAE
jgi:hypothetical protein